MKNLLILLAFIAVILALAACATTAPTVLTKTETIEVPVPTYIAVPAEYTVDCPPTALAGTTIAATLDRLASVEAMLAQCREQVALIKELGLHPPIATP